MHRFTWNCNTTTPHNHTHQKDKKQSLTKKSKRSKNHDDIIIELAGAQIWVVPSRIRPGFFCRDPPFD